MKTQIFDFKFLMRFLSLYNLFLKLFKLFKKYGLNDYTTEFLLFENLSGKRKEF